MKKFKNPDLGLLLLRVGLAAVFIAHGWIKVTNLSMFVGNFGNLGIPAFLTFIVAYVELLGGIALLLGVFAQLAGLLLAVDMFFALLLIRFKTGFVGGYEFELLLLLSALAIFFAGPGKYSLWRKKKLGY